MIWHGDGLLRATATPATAVLGGLTFSITLCNKGNKGNTGLTRKVVHCVHEQGSKMLNIYVVAISCYKWSHGLVASKFSKYKQKFVIWSGTLH